MSCLICTLWFESMAVCGVYFSDLRKEYSEKPQVRYVYHTWLCCRHNTGAFPDKSSVKIFFVVIEYFLLYDDLWQMFWALLLCLIPLSYLFLVVALCQSRWQELRTLCTWKLTFWWLKIKMKVNCTLQIYTMTRQFSVSRDTENPDKCSNKHRIDQQNAVCLFNSDSQSGINLQPNYVSFLFFRPFLG